MTHFSKFFKGKPSVMLAKVVQDGCEHLVTGIFGLRDR